MCGKHKHRTEFVLDPEGVGVCDACIRWFQEHSSQEGVLAAPKECPECRCSFAELSLLMPNGDVPMCLQVKDGTLQFLCLPCSNEYDRKQAQRYKRTPHGAALGL